jgi:hypothetical protein
MDRLRQIGPRPLPLFLLSRQLLPLSCEFDKSRPGVLIFRLGSHPVAFPGAIEALLRAVPHTESLQLPPAPLEPRFIRDDRHGRPPRAILIPATDPAEPRHSKGQRKRSNFPRRHTDCPRQGECSAGLNRGAQFGIRTLAHQAFVRSRSFTTRSCGSRALLTRYCNWSPSSGSWHTIL